MVKTLINSFTASGGGDTPEDLAGALKTALKMDWSSKAKYCVIITDAPCHGKQYHNEKDDYPKGDPNNLIPEELIEKFGKK